jgi:hypothetical protein
MSFYFRSQVFSNSTRYHSTVGQGMSGRLDMGQRTNDVLPAPQKILTGAARGQPGRFGATNQTSSSSNEQMPRFSNIANRNQPSQQQTVDSNPSNSIWNKDQNNKSSFSSNSVGNQQTFGRQQQSGPSQFGINQKIDDNKPSITQNSNRFVSMNSDNQQSSSEQKRSFGREIKIFKFDRKKTIFLF